MSEEKNVIDTLGVLSVVHCKHDSEAVIVDLRKIRRVERKTSIMPSASRKLAVNSILGFFKAHLRL